MSQITSFEVAYSGSEDRMLLTIDMDDHSEFRFWLTRAYTRLLLSALKQLIELKPVHKKVEQEVEERFAATRESRNPVAESLAQRIAHHPLGGDPRLLTNLTARAGDQGSLFLALFDQQNQGLEIAGSQELFLSLNKVVHETLKQADWAL